MRPPDVMVGLRDAGAAGESATHRWPLEVLVAYLFEGRECDDVRAVLARGEGTAHGKRGKWPPVLLSERELTDIEATFPRAMPERMVVPVEVKVAELVAPAESPRTTVSLRPDHPVVQEATSRAHYVRFDYGPWADVYTASLERDQALALLADAALGVEGGESVEVAARLAEEHPTLLRLIAPREDAPPPWAGRL